MKQDDGKDRPCVSGDSDNIKQNQGRRQNRDTALKKSGFPADKASS